ncbi:mannitol-1-phosphate dehydrogenase MPDH1 [Coniophora puteana RWD-64-598 SS2]|uniref:alcohol dehydrogenase n=1 Tax=Coniophora puteana (strain RWD-64-598) TaxID=741705 RepID=A0A5M3N4M4_CONPW|nr:mannitol-1-phosphate dehydrogenase MPDH1 [Coniophora puteana RWD-64-598 SS2]EIW85861.1 mannitol-1-phosphate dehydrogenase MPDH1 [Coniophora puteana RWD-64-598 SS2]
MASSTFDIPRTQRAAQVCAYGKPLVINPSYPVPSPESLAPNECLVKLETAGVCQSDLHARDGDWEGLRPPLHLVCGHEGVGRVVAIGAGTQDSSVLIGDRVGLKFMARTCLRCELCRKGNEASCQSSQVHGFTVDGTFAEYAVSYVDYVTPIPDGLSSAAATPILCAGLTVYKGLKQCNATAGEWIAIPGAGGGLGHLAIQYAVNLGLRVVAIDTGDSKRDLCLSLGAEKWIDFRESIDLVQDVIEATDGGAHAALVAAGGAAPYEQALYYLRPAGTLVAVGLGSGTAAMKAPITVFVIKALKIVGSVLGNRQDVIEALDMAARGKVVTHYTTRRLEDLDSVLHELEQGKITGRVVIEF